MFSFKYLKAFYSIIIVRRPKRILAIKFKLHNQVENKYTYLERLWGF